MRPEPGQVLRPGGGVRVHAVEYRWLKVIRTVRLFAYRLPADRFAPFGDPVAHAMVTPEPVDPLGPPEPVGNLRERAAGADEVRRGLGPPLSIRTNPRAASEPAGQRLGGGPRSRGGRERSQGLP